MSFTASTLLFFRVDLIEPPALLQVVPVRQWLQALGRWPMGQTAQGLYAFQPRCVEFSD